MKKFISVLLAITLLMSVCLCLASCKNDDKTDASNEKVTELTEQDVRILIEDNLDCYFMFYVAPLSDNSYQGDDGYYETDGTYIKPYDELEKLVNDTYTKKTAQKLLEYPSSDSPLYKNVDNSIYFKPEVITPVDYDVIWDDTYTIDMAQISDTQYALTFTTYDFDSNDYVAVGDIVFEDGKWRFDDIIY